MTERRDLFKNTYRSSMALTIDYVFHAVFGRDTDESRGALMEILNIILERKDDPIMSIVLKNPVNTADRENEKETIMDIRAETSSGEELDIEMQSGNLRVYPDRVLFYGGRLEFHFLELGKVDGQKPVEELTETERLAAYLKYANVEEKQDYVQEIVDSEGITMTEITGLPAAEIEKL